MSKSIPKIVVDAVGDDRFTIEHLGEYKGKEVFSAYIPNAKIGCHLYLLKGDKIHYISGDEAVHILCLLCSENVEE